MSDSLNNKELVAVGHQLAKALSSDTAIIDIAKFLSRLAERLDCTTLAPREITKQRDALAAENTGLKQFPDQIVNFIGKLGTSEIGSSTREAIETGAKRIKTPATDAHQAELRAQGVEMFAREMHADISEADAIEFAAQLRKGASA